MQRISTSVWRPPSSVPGLLTAIVVVGLSAFVQARLLLAEPESLGDDVLESCLYLFRERLRAA